MKNILYFLLISFFGLTVQAQNTVVDVIVNSDDHNKLEAAIIAADLVGTLSGTGPFTVFAPTDAAFEALPAGTLDELLADTTGALTNVLAYHVLAADIESGTLSNGQAETTLASKSIYFTINDDGVFVNNARISVTDIIADNGVVHVIDLVLLPSWYTVNNVVFDSPDHSSLRLSLIAEGLTGILSGKGPYTLFAPTDDAFNALTMAQNEIIFDDRTAVLFYHVIATEIASGDLSNGQFATTINGKDIEITIDDGNIFINDAQVVVADIQTDNGIVHVIDAVLIPPPSVTVVDIVVNSDDHTILETALIEADLVETLSGDGPFTVFAPTDDAFNALPDGKLDELLSDPSGDLKDVLLYHVISANALSTDLSDGQKIETLNTQEVNVTIESGNVMINDATVTGADITTDNGVVHVIDKILLPTITSILENDLVKSIEVSPNPTSDFIIINIEGEGIQDANANLIDMNGKTVINISEIKNNQRIALMNLNSGMYILQIDMNEKKYSKKLIIN